MRRLFVLLIVVLSSPLSAQERFFPMSVWYGGGKARAPMLEENPKAKKEIWRKDFQQIKSLGFNAVRCWVDWATAEPVQGQYNFDTVEVLADLAHEMGMKLVVQVYADSAPDWAGKTYPDAHFINISGDVMPSESAPGFCTDHPGVRKAVLGFYSALAQKLKTKPAFFAWDLWSEPHVINWAQALYLPNWEFCYCPYSQARYREWLKQKYGTLEAVNRAWYRRFTDWNDIEPNRLGTILSYTDFIDWRTFIQHRIQQDLAARFEAVKAVLPDKTATSHAASPSLFTSPLWGDGPPDDWMMAQVVDYWGTSFYPKHSAAVGRDVPFRGALLDFTRSVMSSVGKGFWVGELQAGFGTIALRVSSTVTPADMRVWMWSAVARNAKAVNVYAYYPMSTGYEAGGFGLINLDGTITERAKAAGGVARAVHQSADLLLDAKPLKADVAIVYNPLPHFVGGRRPIQVQGQGVFAGLETNSSLGIYRALFPTNTPVDFIHAREVAEGKAGSYKLVFLPYPIMVAEATSKALVEYVRNGGTLVTEARAGWNDERGRASEIIPAAGLHEVCSCRETAVQTTPTGRTELTITDPMFALAAGEKLKGVGYEETLEPLSDRARVIARHANGTPGLIASTFGKGKMLTIGTYLAGPYEAADRDENTGRLFRALLPWAGVSSPYTITGADNIEVRVLESPRGRIAVVFNHGSADASPEIRIAGVTAGTARDIESGASVNLPLKQNIPAGGVRVFHLTSR